MFDKEKSIYLLGQLGLTGVTFLFNIALAYLLDPSKMGEWQTISLIASYSLLLQFGVINGLGREIPYSLGKNDNTRIKEVISSASQYISFLLIILVALFFANQSVMGLENKHIIALALLLSIARVVNNFSIVILRSYQEFKLFGLHQLLGATTLIIFIVVIYQVRSINAIALGVVLALLIPTLISKKFVIFHPVKIQSIISLMKIGLPIYAAGLLFSLLSTIDRWLILYYLDTEALGLYTLAVIALGSVILVPTLLSNIMYPKLAHTYGKHDSIKDLFPMVKRLLIVNTTITGVVSLVGFTLMYFFIVPLFLPKYHAGLNAMSILFLTGLILPIGQSFGDFFNVINKQKLYLKNMAIGFITNAVAGSYLVAIYDFGIEGVAIGTLVGLTIFSLLQSITYYTIMKKVTV